MPETIRYSQLGKEDLALGKGTVEVRLANGTVVSLSQIDAGAILNDSSLSTQALDEVTVKLGGTSVTLARSGNAWLLTTSDSRTNSVDVAQVLRSTTSGTPAAGIGTGLLVRRQSDLAL